MASGVQNTNKQWLSLLARSLLCLVLVSCAPEASPQPERYWTWPERTKKLFWDIRREADVQILSLAVNEGQYPDVPDTYLDFVCRPGGQLSIGSMYIGVPTDVGGIELPTGTYVIAGAKHFEGETEWRKGGSHWSLTELRLSPGKGELASLLARRFCVVVRFPSYESGECFSPPPPKLAQKFLDGCA